MKCNFCEMLNLTINIQKFLNFDLVTYVLCLLYQTMDDGFSVSGVIESLSSVTTTLQCSNTSTSGITRDESIFGILDITPTHGAEVVHTMCLEAGVMYEVTFTFFSFGPLTTRLLDSVRRVLFSY